MSFHWNTWSELFTGQVLLPMEWMVTKYDAPKQYMMLAHVVVLIPGLIGVLIISRDSLATNLPKQSGELHIKVLKVPKVCTGLIFWFRTVSRHHLVVS